jgi:DNA-binding HxlR family transcriptional regulator
MQKDNNISVAILERTAAIRIILYLYENTDRPNNVFLTEIIRNVIASSDTIILTLNSLLKYKIIEDEYTKVYPYKRMFTLTEYGLEIAKPLAEADRALRSQASQEPKSSH